MILFNEKVALLTKNREEVGSYIVRIFGCNGGIYFHSIDGHKSVYFNDKEMDFIKNFLENPDSSVDKYGNFCIESVGFSEPFEKGVMISRILYNQEKLTLTESQIEKLLLFLESENEH